MIGKKIVMVTISTTLALSSADIASPPPCGGVVNEHVTSMRKEPIKKKPKKKNKVKQVNESEVNLLAHLIYAEMGSDSIPDSYLYYCGAVVLNRVKHVNYPNTVKGVIYDKGQFSVVPSGAINKKPTERCYKIAKDLLTNGVSYYGIPGSLIYMSHGRQGSTTWKTYKKVKFCLE